MIAAFNGEKGIAAAEKEVQKLRDRLAALREQNQVTETEAQDAVRIQQLEAEAERIKQEIEFEERRKAVIKSQNSAIRAREFNAPPRDEPPSVEASKTVTSEKGE